MWTIEQARPLLGKMNALAIHCNFNLGLAGSVLDDGYSNKDLDIICLPRSKKLANRQELLAEMTGIIQKELDAFDITLEDIGAAGWSEAELDGRIVWKMEFKIGCNPGIHTIKRIDWIFVDYGV